MHKRMASRTVLSTLFFTCTFFIFTQQDLTVNEFAKRARSKEKERKEKKEQTPVTVDACKISSKVVVEIPKFER